MLRRFSRSNPNNDENGQPYHNNATKPIALNPIPSGDQRPRHALGIIPDNALNLQQHQIPPKPSIQPPTQHQVVHQKSRSKIPVLVDTHRQPQSQPQSQPQLVQQQHAHHQDHIDIEQHIHSPASPEEDSYYYTNEPMSPIINREISNEITNVYRVYDRQAMDPNDEDLYDTTMVAEYGKSIFNYLHELEIKFKPNPRYVEEVQSEVLWEHRVILMDWLIKLHGRFGLLPETLYLAVSIIDRFLSRKNISLSKYQLCGAASLFIAAKYEEINVPTVSQMIDMTGKQYKRQEFLNAEKYIIGTLNFEFGSPGPMSFLRRGSKADDYDSNIRTLAKYFLEVTIMDPRFVASPPSWLAAGAQYLARQMLGFHEWTDAHIYYTGYTVDQLGPLADVLEQCCINYEEHHKHVYEKYSSSSYKKCSVFVQKWLHIWAKENGHA